MAKVKIQGHASGTGVLTVTAPNTSTDRTITLPDSTGTLATTADSVGGATGVDFNDNVKARFGTGNDLEIYSDGDASFIKENGSSELYIRGTNIIFKSGADNDDYIKCHENGDVKLYHSNAEKLATIAQGVMLPNNQEIRFKDNGGNQRTAVMYDSSNTLSVGTSTGNLDLIGGGSYSAIMRISGSNKHATYSNTGSQPTNEGVFHIVNNNNSRTLMVDSTKTSGVDQDTMRLQNSQDSSNGSYDLLTGRNGGGQVFKVQDSGKAYNSTNTWGSLSDQRVKQDIADASSQWDDIKAIKVRKYKLKKLVNRDGADNTPYHIGVVAQELESAGITNLVDESKPEKEDVALHSDFGTIDSEGVFTAGENKKEVKYSILYMKSIKALQEAMARIETLEAKVTALENA